MPGLTARVAGVPEASEHSNTRDTERVTQSGDRDADKAGRPARNFWSGAALWVAFLAALAIKGVGLGYDAPTIAAGIAIGVSALLLVGWLMVRHSGG
jgi:hypothetical protein